MKRLYSQWNQLKQSKIRTYGACVGREKVMNVCERKHKTTISFHLLIKNVFLSHDFNKYQNHNGVVVVSICPQKPGSDIMKQNNKS